MKKLLGIIVLGLLLNVYATTAKSFSSFGKHTGQGELKLTKDAFDLVEFYLSGGQYGNIKNNPTRDWQKDLIKNKAWKGTFLILSKNAKGRWWYYTIYRDDQTDPANYLGKARIRCEKQGHGECFVFAKGNKIVWQNGINSKKGTKIKKKEAKNGMVLIKLKELGFYSDTKLTTTTPKITKKKEPKKIEKKKETKKAVKTYELKGDRSIALSWEGYGDLIAGTVSFDEADYRGNLKLPLPNNDGTCDGTYSLQKGGKGTWQIACSNNMGAAGTLKWVKDGGVTGTGRDHNDKKVKFTVSKNS